jgi:hypothetical protein
MPTDEAKAEIRKWHYAGKRWKWIAKKYNITKQEIHEAVFGDLTGDKQ